MTISESRGSLTWAHIGDLYVTSEQESNHRDFQSMVESINAKGGDTIIVAAPGYRPPNRIADGSDTDTLGACPERHLLGTRWGPNRNGRQW